mmetsp:Transcript_2626/g.3632  ORF Transcript_2626/g.3632 Transcript_2626/m.3632 type:complete len:180 (+) Transcript_2626:21-560(+)
MQSLFSAIISFSLLVVCEAQGKVAPLLPSEFYANMLQNKFNQNGFGVNHTCSGTYYSSLSQMMVRADCTAAGYISNNASIPSPTQSSIFLSLMDFENNLNTVVTWNNLGSTPSCWKGPCGWLPPLAPTFLRDNNAIYGGIENTKFDGDCEKWQFLAKGYFLKIFKNRLRVFHECGVACS